MAFSGALDSLQQSAGPMQSTLPEAPSERELNDAERALTGDNIVETFSETFRVNEIQQRRHALQRTAKLEDPRTAGEVNRIELITINQAITYYQYFPSIVHNTIDILRRYEALRASTPVVSLLLQQGEQQARLYLIELDRALRERTAFANVLLIDAKLSKHAGDEQQFMKLRDEYLASANLSATSKQVLLRGNLDAKWRQGNMLNQRIIDILAGAAVIPGVDEGFLPQRLYIDLLSERYKQILEEEKKAVKDVRLVQARKRHDELARKNERARAGEGEPLTDGEGIEYEDLRKQIADRDAYLVGLAKQRKEVLQEILSFTDVLGADQMHRAELSTIQHQFGDQFNFENVSPPNPDQTPEEIRRRMGEHMEQRSQFHVERFEGFLGRIEEDVLDAGIGEWAENISNKRGREAIRSANHAMTNLLTKVLPESFGLREHVREQLTQPLDEALGWPPGKETWEELTPEEQQKVLEKSQSVLDAIRSFDRTKIMQFRTTIDLLQAMPEASTYLNEEIMQPLPAERVTPENRETLIAEHGGATVYVMLLKQMDADWGGFFGEYSAFLTKVNTTIDTHLDVSGELFRLSNIYDDFKWYFIGAAVLAFGAGVLVALGGYKLLRATGRLGMRVVRFGGRMTVEGAKGTGRVLQGTKESLEKLARSQSVQELTKMRYLDRERALARWMEETRAGRAFAKMRAFSRLKPLRIGGRVLKYSAWAATPALAYYEIHLNAERIAAAEGNAALQEEYRSQDTTTILEAGGAGAALLVPGVLPAAVLAAPVIYAGEYSRNRSEVLAAWKREVEDWMRENDSAGLRQKIKETTLESAVDAGGGGALKPRIVFPSEKDQLEAAELIEQATENSRENMYEAYFWQNLLVPPDTSREDAQRMIRDRMRYMSLATEGRYFDTFSWELEHTDAYAELMERLRVLEAAGEPPVLLYPGEDDEAEEMDLRKLRPGEGQPHEARDIVSTYVNFVRPAEEIVLFNAMGTLATEEQNEAKRDDERGKAEIAVWRTLVRRLSHEIYAAERRVREVDWPGWGITGAEAEAENVVRSYLERKVGEAVYKLALDLLEGDLSPEEYTERLNRIRSMLQEINMENTDAYHASVLSYFGENPASSVTEPSENPLLRLLKE